MFGKERESFVNLEVFFGENGTTKGRKDRVGEQKRHIKL